MRDTHNNEPIEPAALQLPEYVAFSRNVDKLLRSVEDGASSVVSYRLFYSFARAALKIKQQYPILRAVVANDIVCIGAYLPGQKEEPRQEPKGMAKELWDLFADLEVPDVRVVTPEERERDDYSGVERRWRRIEELLAEKQQSK